MTETTFKEAATAKVQTAQPEFLRLPRIKERDPIFGQSRAFWYKAEAEGLIRLKRFRMTGQRNGITLIPVCEARDMLNGLIGGTA